MKAIGKLEKMTVVNTAPVTYSLRLENTTVLMNDLIGSSVTLSYTGEIRCVICDRLTPKAYGQGFCYPCFRDAPENSECIIRPELCRGHLGEGRDPQWEEEHHNKPHAVYLALTSAVKIGVTRLSEIPTRWIDQGAYRALTVAETPYRRLAGEIEIEGKYLFTDRTNWQKMLKDERVEGIDLYSERERLLSSLPEDLAAYGVTDTEPVDLVYPLEHPPGKVKSLNFDKIPAYTGVLSGIRGQYLVFEDNTVINIRRYSGYVVRFTA